MPIKIIDLSSEEAPTDDDLLIIRDMLTGTTRKISRVRFFENPPINAGGITHEMLGLGIVEKENLGETAKISVRLTASTSPSTLTPDVDNFDIFAVTSLNTNMTIAAPIGTPVNGQGMMFRIKDNGSSRTITWNAIYRAVGVTMPTSTSANKMLYVSARWNEEAQKWDVLSVGRE